VVLLALRVTVSSRSGKTPGRLVGSLRETDNSLVELNRRLKLACEVVWSGTVFGLCGPACLFAGLGVALATSRSRTMTKGKGTAEPRTRKLTRERPER
jgi:hypothetical protein